MRYILAALGRLLGWLIAGTVGGIIGALVTLWALEGGGLSWTGELMRFAPMPELAAVREVASPTPPPAMPTATPTSSPTATSTPTPMDDATPSPTVTPTPSIAEIVQDVGAAVVTVINHQTPVNHHGAEIVPEVRGSGVIVHPQGYVVTNHHVVEDHESLEVVLSDGSVVAARWVASDPDQDLALIRIEGLGGEYPVASWGDSDQLRPGEWVLAIGSALGDLPNTVTFGIISGVNRRLDLEEGKTMEGLIQTDAAINRGNSGGPLVNLRGEVIGINAWIIRQDSSFEPMVAEGLGFAIPSQIVREIVERWIAADCDGCDMASEGVQAPVEEVASP
ncbi:MAG TPA: trypsin-like serine protease [Caldilineae bacterium]|nr:trypsin-like serine protease [Caldilineae bacterium]